MFSYRFSQELRHRGNFSTVTEVLRGVDRSLRAAEGHGGAEQGAPRGGGADGGHDLAARVLPAAAWRKGLALGDSRGISYLVAHPT